MKQCIVCGKDESQVKFGFNVAKCNECYREYYRNKHKINPEKERARGREKYHRLYSGKGKIGTAEAKIKWIKNNPDKRRAHNAAYYLERPFPEAQCHHWSYNEEHFLDVIWLTIAQHKKAHRFLIYNEEHKMYSGVYYDVLLDTKESHLDYINWCIENL